MSAPHDDDALEARLRAYRPSAPRPELRARVLAGLQPPRTRPASGLVWWALAALLLVALALHLEYGPRRGPAPRLQVAAAPRPPVLAPEGRPPAPASEGPPVGPGRTRRPPQPRRLVAEPEVLIPAGQREALRRFVAELRKAPVEPASFLAAHFELPQMKEIAAAPPSLTASDAGDELLEGAPAELGAFE